jgi:putative FmdB family regulatory protein
MIYVYKRKDGTTFEVRQRITDKPLTLCPTTGQTVKRVIQRPAHIAFKGAGFYVNDYKE